MDGVWPEAAHAMLFAATAGRAEDDMAVCLDKVRGAVWSDEVQLKRNFKELQEEAGTLWTGLNQVQGSYEFDLQAYSRANDEPRYTIRLPSGPGLASARGMRRQFSEIEDAPPPGTQVPLLPWVIATARTVSPEGGLGNDNLRVKYK
mgnify:CR=1 FL=1